MKMKIKAIIDLIFIVTRVLILKWKTSKYEREILKRNLNIKKIEEHLDCLEDEGMKLFNEQDKKIYEKIIKLSADFVNGKYTADQYSELHDIMTKDMSFRKSEQPKSKEIV